MQMPRIRIINSKDKEQNHGAIEHSSQVRCLYCVSIGQNACS